MCPTCEDSVGVVASHCRNVCASSGEVWDEVEASEGAADAPDEDVKVEDDDDDDEVAADDDDDDE